MFHRKESLKLSTVQ